jgi:hypothetical protein
VRTVKSKPPTPSPQIVILPVLRETIRELPPPRQIPYIPPGVPQLPAPPRYQQPQPMTGYLPAFLAMIGIGGCGIWWLVGQFM